MDGSTGSVAKPVVLVVDDHEDTRHMSVIVLRSQGFQPVAAASGEAAFASACDARPDVIVTDLAMPDGNGWDYCNGSRPTNARITFRWSW